PLFAQWPRQPLQEEVFGDHMAGETFFRHLQELLARPDSGELADVLEVYLLCMLLGFRGRYAGGQGGLQAIMATTREKIERIRGPRPELSPSWRPPTDALTPPRDPWTRRLAIAAGGGALLALLLFALFKIVLHGDIAALAALAATGAAR
ncbi:MAG TPA: DotU family type IV/VI secretion system protein, partial [Longimicrobiales bacterium]